MDTPGAAVAAEATSAVDTEQPMRRRPLRTVDILDERPRRREQIACGLLEKHEQNMAQSARSYNILKRR